MTPGRPELSATGLSAPDLSAWGTVVAGLLTLFLIFGGVGGWAMTQRLASAARLSGLVEVAPNMPTLRHPDGGRIAAVLTSEGAQVRQGEVLLRLDDARPRAELLAVDRRRFALLAREARLRAELAGADHPQAPPELAQASRATPGVAEVWQGEVALFEARRAAQVLQATELARESLQTQEIAQGLAARLAAVEQQRIVLSEDLARQEQLMRKGLARSFHISELQRERARLEGEAGALAAQAAQAASELRRLQDRARTDMARDHSAMAAERQEIALELGLLTEQRAVLAQALATLDLRAPVDGVVLGLGIAGPGDYAPPGAPLLTIVPTDGPARIAARLPAAEAGRLQRGQIAWIVARGGGPALPGRVTALSAATLNDHATGEVYQRVTITLLPGPPAEGMTPPLHPGQPVEVQAITGQRTALAYLTEPLTARLDRTWREE
jgi:HlyD family secretion protein